MIAIIYNYKGLAEHNYLYTDEEIQKYDPELFMSCVTNKGDWIESPLCPCGWKTWEGCYIHDNDVASIKQFLEGRWNSDIKEMEFNNPDTDYSDWYWDNNELNDLYDGIPSDTMKTWLKKCGIVKEV